MPKELEVGSCGLDYTNARLRMSDSKNFGPEKFRANTADVFCNITTCPLALGVEIRFPTIAAPTVQEVTATFEAEARIQESRISEQLLMTRLTRCPILQNQLGKTSTD
jgi:uroporphyrinogen-III decarboxylase